MVKVKLAGRRRSGTIEVPGGKEAFYVPADETVSVPDEFFQMYYAALLAMFKLKGCPKDLIIYMAWEMNKDNLIDFTLRHKEKFSSITCDEEGNRLYTVRTIDNALLQLKERKFIAAIEGMRGSFRVSPLLFFKGGKDRRARTIELHLGFERGRANVAYASKVSYGKIVEETADEPIN